MNSHHSSTVRKLIALPTMLAADISDFRFTHRIGTETEAMRQLLAAGLKAAAESPTPQVKKVDVGC